MINNVMIFMQMTQPKAQNYWMRSLAFGKETADCAVIHEVKEFLISQTYSEFNQSSNV